jgi:hypothetical protein
MGLGLWVPDEVRAEYAVAEESDRHWELAVEFRKVLKAVDERLDIIWVKQGATNFPVAGRWYVTRRSDEGHSCFWVIQTADGKYCPPSQQHLERLQAMDSHAHPDVWNRLRRARQEEQRAAQKRKAETRREFREKLLERLDFNNRVQIPVSTADKDKIAA